jgi:serine/threonine protein kinase
LFVPAGLAADDDRDRFGARDGGGENGRDEHGEASRWSVDHENQPCRITAVDARLILTPTSDLRKFYGILRPRMSLSAKYRIGQRLGGGGMAEVFVASTVGAEGFTRKVAVKRVLAGFSDDKAFADMFVSEARLSSRLQHPNIVSVVDFDRDESGRLFLVMELVEGKDLDALNASGPLPVSAVIHIIVETLRGLGYAHDLPAGDDGLRGLVHRDVSPHNVLLSWEGAVKVSDFGIAKARSASAATASVFIKGKPSYMSPEQANGHALDGRSDLFAVGVMLWEMLAGRRLFVGNTTHEVIARVLFAPIPRPGQHVPADVERVAMRLLERDPSARYRTAEQAIADLLACSSAPRAGRDELIALLGERFATQAPARPRRVPSSGPVATPPVAAMALQATVPAQGTAPTTPAVPVSMVAGRSRDPAGAAMSAETRTLMPETDKVRTRIPVMLWGVIAIVVALAGTLIAVIVTRDDAPATTAAAAVIDAATAIDAATVLAAGAVDAVEVAAAVAVVPPDAAAAPPVDAAAKRPDAAVVASVPRPDARPPADDCTFERDAPKGTVTILVQPWATVTIDNVKIGNTPPLITRTLAAGCHKLKLENVDLGRTERIELKIEDGKTRAIERDFTR